MVRCTVSRKELSPQPRELMQLVGGHGGTRSSARSFGPSLRKLMLLVGGLGGTRSSAHFLGFGGNC